MSNAVYGFCKAGCRHRVPTYDDFLNSASIVKMYATDGAFLLEVGKKYKIAKTVEKATEWGFTVSVKYSETDILGTEYHDFGIALPACSQYDEYLTFRLLDVVLKLSEGIEYNIVVVAEVDGEITEYETGNVTTASSTEWAAVSATVSGATECYLVNEDASIVLEGGGGGTVEVDTTLTVSGQAADAKTVGDRLAAIEAELNYEAIKFTAFVMTPSTTTYELGQSVANVALSWALSKTPVSLTVNGTAIDASATSYTDTNTYTASKSWTVKATEADEKAATATRTASINFYNGVYYGVSSNGSIDTEDSAEILAFTKNLRSGKLTSFSVNAGDGEYIYYCLPKRMGTCSFKVGGFDGGFTLQSEGSFTNASGYTETYYIYRSDNAALGSTSVTVS